ncbi:MAG: hypothetical protein ACE5IZ_10270 [Dehalococcoidia bacterium]
MSKEFASDDPLEMVGVFVPAAPDEDATAEMARAFVEEFALMGYTGEHILRLFKNPFYASAHRICQQRGEAFVLDIIGQILCPSTREEGDA